MKGLVEGLQGKVVYFFIVFLSVSILLNADAKKIHYDSRTGAFTAKLAIVIRNRYNFPYI